MDQIEPHWLTEQCYLRGSSPKVRSSKASKACKGNLSKALVEIPGSNSVFLKGTSDVGSFKLILLRLISDRLLLKYRMLSGGFCFYIYIF